MQATGLLRDDPYALAEATIAVLQGGNLLSSTARDTGPMRDALAVALSQLQSYAPSWRSPGRGLRRHRTKRTLLITE
jgi:hypothetical protein